MSLLKARLNRRTLWRASLVGAATVAAVVPGRARARQKASLVAKKVDKVPEAPNDAAWQTADSLNVPLAPQAVVKPRTYEPGVKAITVRALYDSERVAFLLEWRDPSRDTDFAAVESFRDAVALEFPSNPANGIPYFGMGERNKPVTIYQWKADWQFGRESDVDAKFPNMAVDWYPFSGRGPGEIAGVSDYGSDKGDKVFDTSWWSGSPLGNPDLQARTPVEKLSAEGFGTLTSAGAAQQDASGQGEWRDGAWKVRLSIPRTQDIFTFEPGMTVPVAFAAWEGGKKERDGKKGVSTWYFVSLEQPVGPVVYWGPALAFAGVAAAQFWGLRRLRRTASQRTEPDG